MSLIASTVLYAKGADSGQSIPGAFPMETEAAESHKKQQERMDRHENQGELADIHVNGACLSREGKHPVESRNWLKSLDALEAQPVKSIGLESQQTRHTRLSQRQLENYDDVDIMDAMERGEW